MNRSHPNRRFLDLFENAVGFVLFAAGLLVLIVSLHVLPDPAQIAAAATAAPAAATHPATPPQELAAHAP